MSGEGSGLIMGMRLDGLLRETSEKEVLLRIEEGEAEIRAGRSRFRMLTQDVAEYPELPAFPEATVTVPAAKIDELLRRSSFAVAEEGGRYAIDGVLMVVEDGRIEFAATDGRRLAVASTDLDAGVNIERCVLSRELTARLRALAGTGEPVGICLESGRLIACAGQVLVAGMLLEGSFPAYMEMVPKEGGKRLTVSASNFASKLRQASQLTTEDSRAVTLKIDSGRLTIEAKSAAVGEGSIEIDASYEGEPVVIAFNPQFLLQVLGEFAEGDFTMELISGEKPAVVRCEGFIYVLAPVRVKS